MKDLENFINKVVRQNVEHIVLRCLTEEPLHGYAIIEKIRKTYGVYLGPSTVYPALHKLEDQKQVESSLDTSSARLRKTFKITNKGLREFDYQRQVVQRVFRQVFQEV